MQQTEDVMDYFIYSIYINMNGASKIQEDSYSLNISTRSLELTIVNIY